MWNTWIKKNFKKNTKGKLYAYTYENEWFGCVENPIKLSNAVWFWAVRCNMRIKNICVTITRENNNNKKTVGLWNMRVWMNEEIYTRKYIHYKRGDKSRPNRKYIDTATVNKIHQTDQFPLFGSASFISWNRLFSLAFSCSSPFSWKFLICFQFDQTKYLNDMWLVHTKFMPQISQWSST